MTSLGALAQDQIARLHRQSIDDRDLVIDLLRAAYQSQSMLRAGVSRAAAARICTIAEICEDQLVLLGNHFMPMEGRQYYFTLVLDGDEYFFGAVLKRAFGDSLVFDIPRALYRVERRESLRVDPAALAIDPVPVLLFNQPGQAPGGVVSDISRGGVGLDIPGVAETDLPRSFELELTTRSGQRTRLFADVKNVRQAPRALRLGLSVSTVPSEASMQIEYGHRFYNRRAGWHQVSMASQVAATGADRVWRRIAVASGAKPREVRFRNQLGQEMVGLVNTAGDARGAPAVLIPPAWGKTKETLLPLALTIVETSLRNGLSITVLRFDGTNRRGESFVDAECRPLGQEYLHFRFSQAVRDMQAAVRFLQEAPDYQAPSCVIVSFSLSAVEARRVVAEARPGEISGWIPVVGMVDLQSGLRSVSGGVDYAEGILRGVQFGRHELVGVLADMDFTGLDALNADLVFKEDARRDMARISAPVTWVHGEYDAWIDPERVRDVLSAGTARNRRLVQVPTGHQLRSSREALRTFEFIAAEALHMAWREAVTPRSPSLRLIDRARETESSRRRRPARTELRGFWADYLLGRHRVIGMELFTATSTYRDLMRLQLASLGPLKGSTVLDIGSGTGGFLRELLRSEPLPRRIVMMDLVSDALKQSRENYGMVLPSAFVQLDLDATPVIPCRDDSVDAALASLLLSYIQDPLALLRELRRILRVGGRLVVSSLCRDADVSSIYSEGVAELVASGAQEVMVADGLSFAEVQRSFLNEAARLLDLEEQGLFRFYDERELVDLVQGSGFAVLSTTSALGSPSQATIVVAQREQ